MKRRTTKPNMEPQVLMQVITDVLSRNGLANRMGYSYKDKRKLYESLGYPEETDLTFDYYYKKYVRNEIARAVIDRPIDKTWSGNLMVVEEGKVKEESTLAKAWTKLNNQFKAKKRLNRADKLCHLGNYSLLLFGFDDVKKPEDFKTPANGKKKLLYLRPIAESEVSFDVFEENTANPRYGQPKFYKIKVGSVQSLTSSGVNTKLTPTSLSEITVHHSRVLHFVANSLTNETVGEPYLKSIINRLIDIEKILGGDAEMFWRGARPGYTATEKEDYELDDTAKEALYSELDKYEHDLRRFITARGVDIKALEQQVADPLNHLDIQFQAISGRTGIPKRILVGSERGELSSVQDQDQWLSLIKSRQEEFAEVDMFRPFIDKCMEHELLPKFEEYDVMWEDIFALNEKDKAAIGKQRADALNAYSTSAMSSEILAPKLVFKYILGMNEEQIVEALQLLDEEAIEEELERKRNEGIQDPENSDRSGNKNPKSKQEDPEED
jgi:hypothetical protein